MAKNVVSIVRHLLACICVLAVAPLARAQSLRASSSDSNRPPRVEITAELGLINGLIDLSDLYTGPQAAVIGVGAGVGIRLTRHLGVGIRGLAAAGSEGISQFYELAAIFHLPSAGRSQRFLRLGASGHHEFRDVPESRRANQDHSTTVFPAYGHHKLTPPNLLVAGVGITRAVSQTLGITGEMDFVGRSGGDSGVGVRASAGVTLAVGGYRR